MQVMVLLSLLLGAAATIRCDRLGLGVLSHDETFSWRISQYSVPDLIRRTGQDAHPPLYYLSIKAWVALWGSSPVGLRSLSVLLGVLSVAVIYVLCYEACDSRLGRNLRSKAAAQRAALLSAFLTAIHVSQVAPSRSARMYAMGVFLAGLTGWLLLRSLRARQRPELWWSAYGLAVAAFCCTHYYAFFTVFAQALFAAGDLLVSGFKCGFRQVVAAMAGFLFAATIAVVLYSAWLPIFVAQAQDVGDDFWIPPLTAQETEHVFFSWGTGLAYQGLTESRLWMLFVSLCIAWTLWRADRSGWFFLLQAVVPWVFSIGISIFSGRPILIERYLVFAQFALLGFWGVTAYRLPGWPEQLGLACLVCLPSLIGLSQTVMQYPGDSPALAVAADFLKENYRPGDVIATATPADINRLRYYAHRAGIDSLDVRCRLSPLPGKGHVNHLASISSDEILWTTDSQSGHESFRRLWTASDSPALAGYAPGDMKMVLARTFEGGGGTRYILALYERQQ